MTRTASIACACAVALGCGPGVEPDADETADSTGTSSSPSSEGESTSSDDTGPEDDCNALRNDEASQPVTLVIENSTADPIYWSFACYEIPFVLRNAEGDEIEWFHDGWSPTCEALFDPDVACGGPACSGLVRVLYPGGTFETEWPGYRLEWMHPGTCIADPEGACIQGGECPIERSAPSGRYTAAVDAWGQAPCAGGDCGQCEPTQGGTCTVEAEPDWEQMPDLRATVEFDYPGENRIVVRFE